MFLCKRLSALFPWCHCQIILFPLILLLAPSDDNQHSGASPYGALASPITVAANKVALTPGQEIVLKCKIDNYPKAEFDWFKQRVYSNKDREAAQADGRIINEEKQNINTTDDRYVIGANSIVIKSSRLDDAGDYFCKVRGDYEVESREKMISVRPKPFVADFNLQDSTMKSANILVGKPLRLPCTGSDDFVTPDKLNLTWLTAPYDELSMNEVHSGEDGITIFEHNATSKVLIIDEITHNHRRHYKCQVSNGITENSKSILIRVKDKYAFIWPAVGIVVELFILIGVIIVVENRKIEPDKEVYDRKAIQM